jgi:hypothetical protein
MAAGLLKRLIRLSIGKQYPAISANGGVAEMWRGIGNQWQ